MAGLTRRSALRLAASAGLGGALSAALTACGLAAPTRGARSAAQLTLLADASFVPAAQALADTYAAAAGSAAAPLVQVASPSLQADMQDMLTGDPSVQPDLIFATPAVRSMLPAAALMVNLAPALSQTGIAPALYPACLEYGASGPRQLILPVFRDPLVVFYNADACARAGADPPRAGWTLEAFSLLCQQLQGTAAGLAAPLANATNIFDLELFCAFVAGYGGQMLQAANVGYTPQFASAQGAEACGALAALHAYEPPVPPPSARDLFGLGEVALYFGHHSDVAPLAAQISGLFAWNVAPMPQFPIRAAQTIVADGVAAVTTDPNRRSAAMAVALFAGTAPAQDAMARTGIGVPALQALASSDTWRAAGPQIDDDVFVARAQSDVIVQLPLYLIESVIEAAMQAIVGGYPKYTALVEAATVAQYQLATWQD